MGSVKKPRRSYTREYKFEAVKLTTEGGLSVAQAARDLGLNESTLHNWRRHSSLGYLSPAEYERRACAA